MRRGGPGSVTGSVTASQSSMASSNLGSGRKNSIFTAFFGVFFILCKNQKSTPFIVYISYCIDYISLLSFNFRPEFPWSEASKEYLSVIAGSIQVRFNVFLNSYESGLTVWAIVTTFLAFCTLIVVYVARGFQTNRFKYVWPIQFLSAVVSVLVTVLLVPVLNTYLIFLNCTYIGVSVPILDAFPERKCWDFSANGNGSIAAVSVLLIILMLVLSFCVVVLKPTSDPTLLFPGDGPSQKFESVLMAVRTIQTILGTLISRRTTILGWISLAVNGLALLLLLVWLPYYNPLTNRVRTGMFASLTWASLCLVVCTSRNDPSSDAILIALFIGLPITAVVGAFLSERHMKKGNGFDKVQITRTMSHFKSATYEPVRRNSPSSEQHQPARSVAFGDSPSAAASIRKTGIIKAPKDNDSSRSSTPDQTRAHQNYSFPPGNAAAEERNNDAPPPSPSSIRRLASRFLIGNTKDKPAGETSALKPAAKLTFAFEGKFNTDVDVELATRFALDATGPDRDEKIGAANCLWEVGVKAFPDSTFLLINYSNFLRFVMKNDSAADGVYAKLASMSIPLWARFTLFCFYKDMESKRQAQSYAGVGGTMDVASLVEFQKMYKAAQKYHWEAILAMKRLWRSLLTRGAGGEEDSKHHGGGSNFANLRKDKMKKGLTLAGIASSLADIYDASSRASRHYNMLLSKYSQAPRLLRAYAAFVNDCYNDNDQTQELLRQAEALDEPEAVARRKSKEDAKGFSSGGETDDSKDARQNKQNEEQEDGSSASESGSGSESESEVGSGGDDDSSMGQVSSDEQNTDNDESHSPHGGVALRSQDIELNEEQEHDALIVHLSEPIPNSPNALTTRLTISQFSESSQGEGLFSTFPADFANSLIGRKLIEFLFLDGISPISLAQYFDRGASRSCFIATTIARQHSDGVLIPATPVRVTVQRSQGAKDKFVLTIESSCQQPSIGVIRATQTSAVLSFDESVVSNGLVVWNNDIWTLTHQVRFPQGSKSFFPYRIQSFENPMSPESFVLYEFQNFEENGEIVISVSQQDVSLTAESGHESSAAIQSLSASRLNMHRQGGKKSPEKSKVKIDNGDGNDNNNQKRSKKKKKKSQKEKKNRKTPAKAQSETGSRRSFGLSSSGSSRSRRRKKQRMAEMVDIRKKSTVWLLRRKIRISLVVAVLFIVATAIATNSLTQGAFLNVVALDFGGDVPGKVCQVVHGLRSIDFLANGMLDAAGGATLPEVSADLDVRADDLDDIFYNLYAAPATANYAPISEYFTARSIYGMCPDGVTRTPDNPKYYSKDCSYNLPGLAQKFVAQTREIISTDFTTNRTAASVAKTETQFRWALNFGPSRIFVEFLKLPVMFDDSVRYFMSQMKSIQAGVQSACIGIMLVVSFVVLGPSLKRTFEDRLEALRIFKMIPPDVAERLLSRPYMFSLKELNGEDDDSDSDSTEEGGDQGGVGAGDQNSEPEPVRPPPPSEFNQNQNGEFYGNPEYFSPGAAATHFAPQHHYNSHNEQFYSSYHHASQQHTHQQYQHQHQHDLIHAHSMASFGGDSLAWGGYGGNDQVTHHGDRNDHPHSIVDISSHLEPERHHVHTQNTTASSQVLNTPHSSVLAGHFDQHLPLPPIPPPPPGPWSDGHLSHVPSVSGLNDDQNWAEIAMNLQHTPAYTPKSVTFGARASQSQSDIFKPQVVGISRPDDQTLTISDDTTYDRFHDLRLRFWALVKHVQHSLGFDLTLDEKAAKSEEKEVQESPQILIQRRVYEITVMIIIGLLVIGIILSADTVEDSTIGSTSLSISNFRIAHAAAARYFVREWIIFKTNDLLQTLLHHLDAALKYHFALLEGSAELDIPKPTWKDLNDGQQYLLYAHQCLIPEGDRSDTPCPEEGGPSYDILMSGLNTVMYSFVASIDDSLQLGPNATLTTESFLFSHTIAWPQLLAGLSQSMDMYRETVLALLQKNLEIQMVLVTVVILCNFFLYFVPFRKILAHLPLETEQTLSILKLLPDDVISSNTRIANFIAAAEEQLLLIEREQMDSDDA